MDLEQLIEQTETSGSDFEGQRNVLVASAEVAPFTKTGALGDVAGALPKALAKNGDQVAVLTPLYDHLEPDRMHLARRLRPLTVPRRGKSQEQVEATLWEGRLDHGVRIFFVECDEYFSGDHVYDYETEGGADAAGRWSFFARAVVEFTRQFSIPTEVVHLNDWHTALAPVYRDHYYDTELGDTPFVLTIHNLGHQGTFDEDAFDETGLPQSHLDDDELLYDGDLNFLKAGLEHADALTTVSPTYAEEIQTEEHGQGLDDIVSRRADDLRGILNGADYSVWSPPADKFIPVRYDIDDLNGKRQNKAELQHEFDLAIRPSIPLVGFIGRLNDRKGLDILLPAIEQMLEAIDDPREGFQAVFLGEGSDEYENRIEELADTHDRWVGAHIGYDEELAHLYQAGCDILTVPSRYEPCGLTQLYALKYGTLPVVHETGGLADTVVDVEHDEPSSTGFVFDDYSVDALRSALERAVGRHSNYRQWRPLMERAMERDFSWSTSARQYRELYDERLNSSDVEKAAE